MKSLLQQHVRSCFGLLASILLVPTLPQSSAQAAFIAHSAGKADVAVSHDGVDYLRFGTAVWGPNWAWTGVEGKTRSENGVTVERTQRQGRQHCCAAGFPRGADGDEPAGVELRVEGRSRTPI